MNTTPDCAAIEQMLSDMLAGGLDDASLRILNEHLEHCEACSARSVAMYTIDRALFELGAQERLESLKQRIHEGLDQSRKTSKLPAIRRLRTVRLKRFRRPAQSLGWLFAAAASVLIVATLYMVYGTKTVSPSSPEVLAHLSSFSGSPVVIHEGRTLAAREKLNLVPGDSISVPVGSNATVVYADQDTKLVVAASSVLRLKLSEKGKRVYLESGSLNAEVAPQTPGTTFVINTPMARAEVIGTKFQLSAQSDQTRLDVAHGRVRLVRGSDNAQVEVAASQFAVAQETGLLVAQESNPQPIKREQIKRLITSAEQNELKAKVSELKSEVVKVIAKFTAQTLKNSHGSMAYRLFTPEIAGTDKKLPLVIYLHGIGGAGKDNMKQLSDQPFGAGIWALPTNQARHPCFVVAPQTPGGWVGNPHVLALDIVDELLKTLPIDRQRIYVTGISSGGNGVFWLLQTRPQLFAAGVPISGWMPDSKNAAPFAHIPVWLFHGNTDTTIKVNLSRQAFDTLSAAGADVRFYEFDGSGHDIFAPAYCTPDLIDWVFSRSSHNE